MSTPASTSPPRQRDPWLDNVKVVLVTIVVIGHLLVVSPGSRAQSWVYDFIYYFHIPAFVLVTGYLSRTFRYTRRHLMSVLATLIVPYIIFSWLMVWWRHLAGGEALLDPIWTDPRWPMWYLIVTAMWRLVTPILRLHWVMVPLSVVVSLLAGLTNQELFDLNRFMGFLPFFVLGLHLRPEHLAALRSSRARVPAAVVLVLTLWLARHTDAFWSTQFLFFRADYASLGAGFEEGAWIRIRLIGVAVATSAAVLALVPRRRSFLTAMGAYTLVVYLCHGFVVRGLEYRGWADLLPADHPWVTIAINVSVAIGISLVLAWRPIGETLLWLVDPVNTVTKHLRRRREPADSPA